MPLERGATDAVNEGPPSYRDRARRAARSWGSVIAITAIGIVATWASYQGALSAEQSRVRATLELRAEWRARDVEAKIRAAANPVEALAVFIASQGIPDSNRLHRFARWS